MIDKNNALGKGMDKLIDSVFSTPFLPIFLAAPIVIALVFNTKLVWLVGHANPRLWPYAQHVRVDWIRNSLCIWLGATSATKTHS